MKSILAMAGAVALLVWGLYMVKTGILRTFGDALRGWLAKRLRNRFEGFAAGFGLAALLQSSTATALLVAGLQKKGLVATAAALACVLGADLGSAVVVKVLSLDLSGLIPLLVIAGVALFMRRAESRAGQFGRVLLGLAFIMSALRGIVAATAPLRESAGLVAALDAISAQPLGSLALGAALAIACFSSLAVVAIAAAAAASGLLPGEAAVWVVLGANFGSALLALLSTLGSSPIARRAPLGNFFFRSAACAAGAVFLSLASGAAARFGASPEAIVAFHVAFNAAVGAMGLSLLTPAAKLVEQLLPSNAFFPSTDVKLMAPENLVSSATALSLAEEETAKTARLFAAFWPKVAAPFRENRTNKPMQTRSNITEYLSRV